MRNNKAVMTGMIVSAAMAWCGPAWAQIGFGPGESMDPGRALKDAREISAPAVQGAPVGASPVKKHSRRHIREPLAAQPAKVCPQVSPVIIDKTQAYADSLGSGLCFISIDPTEMPGLVYRAFDFFDDGLMMVFSSYGDGEGNPNMTSAREFFFFPRLGIPELSADPKAGTVSVRMGDGGRADFDPATAQLSGLERGSVKISPHIDPAERGGVEIPTYAGLMLDAGFRKGESPTGLPNAASTFRDAQGHKCTVKNRYLFDYVSGGDHVFKFTDAQLSAWLKTACPSLKVGF